MYSIDYFVETADGLNTQTCENVSIDTTTEGMSTAGQVIAFSALSMILTGGVAVMMYRNPQLMAHPNKLIYYMCLCEGIVAW